MSGPSDKAVDHAITERHVRKAHGTRGIIEMAHDPALGFDRSVCLRDVVEALEGHAADHMYEAREHILRKFGSGE